MKEDMALYQGKAPVSPSDAESTLTKFLEAHPATQIISVQWLDMCGITRTRLLPVQRLKDLVRAGSSIGIGPLAMIVPTTEDIIPAVFEHFTATAQLYPDLRTLRPAAHDPASLGNVAVVCGEVPWENLDARVLLKKAVARAEKEHNMHFLVGFEIEVVFLKAGSLEKPVNSTRMGFESAREIIRSPLWPVLNEVVVAMAEAGITVYQLIKEAGAGQWEMALPPLPPVEACDALAYARETLKNVALKHGLNVTLYPIPYVDKTPADAANGLHIHMSASPVRELREEWDDDTIMAGLLAHLPEVAALGLAQADSYRRVGPGKMGAGHYVCWGDQNRDCPVRRVSSNHWEVRCHDGTSNPYAVLAALVTAATDRRPLTHKNVTKFIPKLTEEEKKELELTELLPTSLPQALEEFDKRKEWVATALSKEYAEWYVTLKKHEMEKHSGISETERRLQGVTYF